MAEPEEILGFGRSPNGPSRDRFVVRHRRLLAVIAVPVVLVAGLYFANEEFRGGSEGPSYGTWMSRYDASDTELKAALFDHLDTDRAGFVAECGKLSTIADDGERLRPTGNDDADSASRQAVRKVRVAANTCVHAWADQDVSLYAFVSATRNAKAWLEAFKKLNGESA